MIFLPAVWTPPQLAYEEPTIHNFDYVENRPDALAGSLNGQWIACGSAGCEVALWRKKGSAVRKQYSFRLDSPVVSISVSDLGVVKAFCASGTYRILRSTKVITLDRVDHAWVDFKRPVRYGGTSAEVTGKRKSLLVYATGHRWSFDLSKYYYTSCLAIAVSKDGKRVGLGIDGRVWLFDAPTGRVLSSGSTGDGVWALAFLGNHTLLAATRPSELGYLTDHEPPTK